MYKIEVMHINLSGKYPEYSPHATYILRPEVNPVSWVLVNSRGMIIHSFPSLYPLKGIIFDMAAIIPEELEGKSVTITKLADNAIEDRND